MPEEVKLNGKILKEKIVDSFKIIFIVLLAVGLFYGGYCLGYFAAKKKCKKTDYSWNDY